MSLKSNSQAKDQQIVLLAVPPLPPARARRPGRTDSLPTARLDAFLARLKRMSKEERVRAARYGAFTPWERSVWASRFPEQVPLLNGEFEWIALGLADLD
jgi:hypothetical protein